MYSIRGTHPSVQRCPRESRSRIGNYESGEPEIAGHPGRSRNAVVRREPNQDERVDSIVAQIFFKARSNKSAVHMLAIDGLCGFGSRNRLNRIPGDSGRSRLFASTES